MLHAMHTYLIIALFNSNVNVTKLDKIPKMQSLTFFLAITNNILLLS